MLCVRLDIPMAQGMIVQGTIVEGMIVRDGMFRDCSHNLNGSQLWVRNLTKNFNKQWVCVVCLCIVAAGAIRAPIMTECMSKTSWAQVLAASPAPWGEVSTSKLVISTPKSALTTVRDPCAVTSYWNQVQLI